MNRRSLALLGIGLLLVLAGCSSGTQEVPTEELSGDISYDWERSETVYYNVTHERYEAVHDLKNQSSLEIYTHDALGTQIPLDITALAYRFQNGTVVNATHPGLAARKGDGLTNITLPASSGRVGYTGSRNGKEFSMPAFIEGSYAVRLPTSARVLVPLLSQVSPGGYDRSISDDRVTVTWEEISGGSIHLRWYLELDLLLFGVIAIGGLGLAIGGTLYYLRKIRRLRQHREDVGIDVDQEDDDPRDRGPPPGMG